MPTSRRPFSVLPVLALCLLLALFLPYVCGLPELAFGRWPAILAGRGAGDGPAARLFGFLSFAIFNSLAFGPLFLAGLAGKDRPMAFWLALILCLGIAPALYGDYYRTLGGDGLEILGIPIVLGFMAMVGGVLGAVIEPWVPRGAVRHRGIALAILVGMGASFYLSYLDAAGFEARREAWRQRVRGPVNAAETADAAKLAEAARACLGHASPDRRIRLFSEDECRGPLEGNWVPNGECLKREGGSYSWDLRETNAHCP